MKEIKNSLYKYACRLSSIKRFGGRRLHHEYNVAEHTFRVAMLAMQIVDRYNSENETKVNVEEVLRKALLHDIEESCSGDIPSPFKRISQDFYDAYRGAADRAMKEIILEGIEDETKARYIDLWKADKSGETGEVIKLADDLEAFATICFELKHGNLVIGKIYKSYVKSFGSDEMKPLLKKYTKAQEFYQFHKNMIGKEMEKTLEDKDYT